MDNSLQIGASSGSDIDAFLEDFAGTPRLLDLFALCALLRGAVFSDGYTVDPRWAAAVVPSASGNELLRLESDIARGVSDAERMLALFLTFYHRPLFIDVERSSPEHLREIVTQEIFAEKLRWPYRF